MSQILRALPSCSWSPGVGHFPVELELASRFQSWLRSSRANSVAPEPVPRLQLPTPLQVPAPVFKNGFRSGAVFRLRLDSRSVPTPCLLQLKTHACLKNTMSPDAFRSFALQLEALENLMSLEAF